MDAVRENYYYNHIAESQHALDPMPLVHVCDCFTFRKILVSGQITPTLCKVFNKELSYFFYGRPSYRVGPPDITSNATSMFPICFIIESSHIETISDVYPFDTGAFCAGLFSKYVHPDAKVTDFKLLNTLSFLQKFIGYFYSDNTNYYDGKATIVNSNLPVMAFELHSLHQLITSQTTETFDDRCHTIEIQTQQMVDINAGAIKAIVMPTSIASDPTVSSFLYDNNVQLIDYNTIRCRPSSVTATIITEVRKYYENEGII